MARRLVKPRGVDPNVWAQLQLQERALETAERIEKTRRRRDVLMSLAQSMSVNPILSNATVAFTGAAVATVGEVTRHVAAQSLETSRLKAETRNKLQKWKLPGTALEWVGKGAAAFAGGAQIGDTAAKILSALRSDSQATSIAFDIPDSEGPAVSPASAAAAPFRRTFHPADADG